MNKYQIVYADPPWTYKKSVEIKSARGLAKKYYNTMSLEDIKNLSIQNICDKNCYLFLWCTAPCMPEGIEVLKAWGFEWSTIVFTWIKLNKIAKSLFWGMGNFSRANPEFVLLGRKGKIERVERNVHSVIQEVIGKHSQKPEEVRKRIIRLCGNLSKIELFAREKIEGWVCIGNDIDGMDIRESLKLLGESK